MSDGPDTKRVLLTIDEAAERLGICRRTLQDHVKDGAIKYISVGRGTVRRRRLFHPDDIQAFIDAQRTTELPVPVEVRCPTSRRRKAATPAPVYGDFLAERAARVAARRAESEKRNGWAPGTLERRAQKQEDERMRWNPHLQRNPNP